MNFCFVNVDRKSNKDLSREYYALDGQNADNDFKLVSEIFPVGKSV